MRITYTMVFISFFIIIISGTILTQYSNDKWEQLYFETIGSGYHCNHRNKLDYVINTHQEWENLWNRTFLADHEILK